MNDQENAATPEEPRNGSGEPEKLPVGSILIQIDANRNVEFSVNGKLGTDEMLLMVEKVRIAVYAQMITNLMGAATIAQMKKAAGSIQLARPGQNFPNPRRDQ